MTRHHFWNFFYRSGGKLKRMQTKPRLTLEHMKERLKFAEKWDDVLESDEEFYMCFLDEKWFYTSTRRKMVKILPRALFETLKDAFYIAPKVRSRRHPCKVMFLGLIAPPITIEKETGETVVVCDGKLMMKRVCRGGVTDKSSCNQQFSPYWECNNKLKMVEWKLLIPKERISVSEALTKILSKYPNIDPAVTDRLCFQYHTYHITTNRKTKRKQFRKINDLHV